jgi:hypothetical protein
MKTFWHLANTEAKTRLENMIFIRAYPRPSAFIRVPFVAFFPFVCFVVNLPAFAFKEEARTD